MAVDCEVAGKAGVSGKGTCAGRMVWLPEALVLSFPVKLAFLAECFFVDLEADKVVVAPAEAVGVGGSGGFGLAGFTGRLALECRLGVLISSSMKLFIVLANKRSNRKYSWQYEIFAAAKRHLKRDFSILYDRAVAR